MQPDQISASDAFAIAMIGMILLSMSVIGLLVICMRRNAARRNTDVDDLLDEVAEDEKSEKRAAVPGEAAKPPEPWEKEPDWWKK